VAGFDGAEIKTEGDSFYVVFASATAAVGCGVAIVDAAATETRKHPEQPINVAVGIHAGEAAETDEGFVGSAINVAARICAVAAAGEVLVSDTVRGLTRTGDTLYVSRGQRRLKGIAEPMAVFAAVDAKNATLKVEGGARFGRAWLIVGAVILVVAIGSGEAFMLSRGAPGTASSSLRPTSSPTLDSLYSDMPFGVEVPPGRWGLPVFYMRPDVEVAAGWTIGVNRCGRGEPQCGSTGNDGYDQGLVQLTVSDRPQSQLVLFHPTELLTEPCAVNLHPPTIGPDDSYLDWMRAQSSLMLSNASTRVFTNVRATVMDVTVVDASACSYSTPHYVSMNTYSQESTFFELQSGTLIRVFALTVPRNVFAFAIAPTQEEFDQLGPRAEAVLKSLHFPSQ